MHPEIKVWLKDIELSIKEIYEFLPAPRTLNAKCSGLRAQGKKQRLREILMVFIMDDLPREIAQSPRSGHISQDRHQERESLFVLFVQ
jgi:hypothetical protein